MKATQMRAPVIAAFLCLSMVSLSQDRDNGAEPQRLGDLLIDVAGIDAPGQLNLGQGKFAPPSEHYWVVALVNFRNAGKRAVCATFAGSLKAEYGLVVRSSGPLGNVAPISELLPGEEVQRSFIFSLKRGASPLTLAVETVTYGGDCGDGLPRSAATSVQVPVRGVSSPQDEESRIDTSKPATPPPVPTLTPKQTDSNGVMGGSGAYRVGIGGGVSPPQVIYKVAAKYSEEALKAKFQGTVVLFVVVDEKGHPHDLKVIRPLGLGLDQKAIEAMEQWRFKPGMKDGRPVPVQATIEVNFRLPVQK